MNKRQIIISSIGTFMIFIMGFIPPWKTIDHSTSILIESPMGYYPIFSPPTIDTEFEMSVRIDILRLAVQWITVLFVMGIALFISQTKKTDTDDEEEEDF